MFANTQFVTDEAALVVMASHLDVSAYILSLQSQGIEATVVDFPFGQSVFFQVLDEMGMAGSKGKAGVSTSSEAVENILSTYKHFIAEERKLIELAEKADDVVTADMLTGYLKEQEKWYGCL